LESFVICEEINSRDPFSPRGKTIGSPTTEATLPIGYGIERKLQAWFGETSKKEGDRARGDWWSVRTIQRKEKRKIGVIMMVFIKVGGGLKVKKVGKSQRAPLPCVGGGVVGLFGGSLVGVVGCFFWLGGCGGGGGGVFFFVCWWGVWVGGGVVVEGLCGFGIFGGLGGGCLFSFLEVRCLGGFGFFAGFLGVGVFLIFLGFGAGLGVGFWCWGGGGGGAEWGPGKRLRHGREGGEGVAVGAGGEWGGGG